MQSIRSALRLWVTIWLVVQVASLTALVPRDCCAAHSSAARAAKPGCHEQVAATQCPMRATDGTPCPMHRGGHGEASETTPDALRDARDLQRADGCAGRAVVQLRRPSGRAPGAARSASRRGDHRLRRAPPLPFHPPGFSASARVDVASCRPMARVCLAPRVVVSHVEVSRAEFEDSGACGRAACKRQQRFFAAIG